MQKRHRIFISINLPQDIKKQLAGYSKKWAELPAKWTALNNLHITLVFLGDLTEVELGEVCITIKEVIENHNSFDINLSRVSYGPDGKIPPRMIWASGEKIEALSLLKRNLEDALLEKVNFLPEKRISGPHITLARISTFQWRAIEPEERPEVDENIDLTFTVESIDIMESELKKGGPQYNIIESHLLK